MITPATLLPALVVLLAHLPLPEGVELPLRVACAVTTVEIGTIDETASEYEATYDIVQRWQDPRVGFDRVAEGTDRRDFTGAAADEQIGSMWTPEIEIDNLVGDPTVRASGLRVFADGRVERIRRVHGRFRFDLDLARFPFDEQSLPLHFVSTVYSARQVELVHTEEDDQRSGVDPTVALAEFEVEGIDFESSAFRGWNGATYSALGANVGVQRIASAYVPSLFAPLLVILLLPLLCLWVRTEVHERVNWVVTALFALVALNFSVSLEYPALGVDAAFMRLFWYGYALQASILGLILLLFNEGAFVEAMGEDTIEEIVEYAAWAVPLLFAWAVADVVLGLAI